MNDKSTREYRVWSSEEEDALRMGVTKHGVGAWELIRSDPEFPALERRSGVQLKDKWRNLIKFRHISAKEAKQLHPKLSGPWSKKYSNFGIFLNGLDTSTREVSTSRRQQGVRAVRRQASLKFYQRLGSGSEVDSDDSSSGVGHISKRQRQEHRGYGIYDQRRYDAGKDAGALITLPADAPEAGVTSLVVPGSEGGGGDECDVGDEDAEVSCLCGVRSDDGQAMIECEICKVWAHTACLQQRMDDDPIHSSFDLLHYRCLACKTNTTNTNTIKPTNTNKTNNTNNNIKQANSKKRRAQPTGHRTSGLSVSTTPRARAKKSPQYVPRPQTATPNPSNTLTPDHLGAPPPTVYTSPTGLIPYPNPSQQPEQQDLDGSLSTIKTLRLPHQGHQVVSASASALSNHRTAAAAAAPGAASHTFRPSRSHDSDSNCSAGLHFDHKAPTPHTFLPPSPGCAGGPPTTPHTIPRTTPRTTPHATLTPHITWRRGGSRSRRNPLPRHRQAVWGAAILDPPPLPQQPPPLHNTFIVMDPANSLSGTLSPTQTLTSTPNPIHPNPIHMMPPHSLSHSLPTRSTTVPVLLPADELPPLDCFGLQDHPEALDPLIWTPTPTPVMAVTAVMTMKEEVEGTAGSHHYQYHHSGSGGGSGTPPSHSGAGTGGALSSFTVLSPRSPPPCSPCGSSSSLWATQLGSAAHTQLTQATQVTQALQTQSLSPTTAYQPPVTTSPMHTHLHQVAAQCAATPPHTHTAQEHPHSGTHPHTHTHTHTAQEHTHSSDMRAILPSLIPSPPLYSPHSHSYSHSHSMLALPSSGSHGLDQPTSCITRQDPHMPPPSTPRGPTPAAPSGSQYAHPTSMLPTSPATPTSAPPLPHPPHSPALGSPCPHQYAAQHHLPPTSDSLHPQPHPQPQRYSDLNSFDWMDFGTPPTTQPPTTHPSTPPPEQYPQSQQTGFGTHPNTQPPTPTPEHYPQSQHTGFGTHNPRMYSSLLAGSCRAATAMGHVPPPEAAAEAAATLATSHPGTPLRSSTAATAASAPQSSHYHTQTTHNNHTHNNHTSHTSHTPTHLSRTPVHTGHTSHTPTHTAHTSSLLDAPHTWATGLRGGNAEGNSGAANGSSSSSYIRAGYQPPPTGGANLFKAPAEQQHQQHQQREQQQYCLHAQADDTTRRQQLEQQQQQQQLQHHREVLTAVPAAATAAALPTQLSIQLDSLLEDLDDLPQHQDPGHALTHQTGTSPSGRWNPGHALGHALHDQTETSSRGRWNPGHALPPQTMNGAAAAAGGGTDSAAFKVNLGSAEQWLNAAAGFDTAEFGTGTEHHISAAAAAVAAAVAGSVPDNLKDVAALHEMRVAYNMIVTGLQAATAAYAARHPPTLETSATPLSLPLSLPLSPFARAAPTSCSLGVAPLQHTHTATNPLPHTHNQEAAVMQHSSQPQQREHARSSFQIRTQAAQGGLTGGATCSSPAHHPTSAPFGHQHMALAGGHASPTCITTGFGTEALAGRHGLSSAAAQSHSQSHSQSRSQAHSRSQAQAQSPHLLLEGLTSQSQSQSPHLLLGGLTSQSQSQSPHLLLGGLAGLQPAGLVQLGRSGPSSSGPVGGVLRGGVGHSMGWQGNAVVDRGGTDHGGRDPQVSATAYGWLETKSAGAEEAGRGALDAWDGKPAPSPGLSRTFTPLLHDLLLPPGSSSTTPLDMSVFSKASSMDMDLIDLGDPDSWTWTS